jgi:hypothetical protein
VWILAQQINSSLDTVYCIFGTTDQLFLRYCILNIWHNRPTAHQIQDIVYLAQQINCSSDTGYCIFGTTDQLLIRYCILYIWHNRPAAHQILYIVYSSHTLHKKCKCNEAVHLLFTDFKKAYDSVRWEVFITL